MKRTCQYALLTALACCLVKTFCCFLKQFCSLFHCLYVSYEAIKLLSSDFCHFFRPFGIIAPRCNIALMGYIDSFYEILLYDLSSGACVFCWVRWKGLILNLRICMEGISSLLCGTQHNTYFHLKTVAEPAPET
jgi:hypothetical protein